MKMIIGLTGTKAGGKGEVAEILKEKGFIYSSLSDRVREEAVSRGLKNYKIKDLQDIGNELREKFGLGILARKTLELLEKELEEGKNIVIDGIRNLGEINELRKEGDFILISVDAPQEKRYKRLMARKRASDPKNWQEFLEMERRDLGLEEENSGQQVARCMEKANYKIYNDGSLEDLHKKINEVLRKILS